MNSPASSIAVDQARLDEHQARPRLAARRVVGGAVQIRSALIAIVMSAFLVIFLAALQTDFSGTPPTLSIRSLDSLPGPGAALPPPPPPPSSSTVAEQVPQAPTPDLPKLNLDLTNMSAPAVKAQIAKTPDFSLIKAEFSTEGQLGSFGQVGGEFGSGRPSMTFSAAELDSQPRLVNKPTVSYPASQAGLGVKEGRVTLEVMISSAGRVSIQRVISSSHNDFTAMARSFATRALFTPPKNDGRPVNAIYRWPLIFKP